MKLKKKELLEVLAGMVKLIENDDSFEGSLTYNCIDDRCQPGEFIVEGSWRIGNSEGQGGWSMTNPAEGDQK